MGGTDPRRNDAHRFAPAASDESIVFGACSPGWHSAGEHATCLDQWIEHMQAAGIQRVCCLLPGRQLEDNDANVGRYRETFGEDRVLHAPIPDHHLTSHERLDTEILPFLEAAAKAEEPTVVHCLAGIGRTGQVLAAWLVSSRGYRPQEAIDTVQEHGRDPTDPVRCGTATEAELYDLLASVANV